MITIINVILLMFIHWLLDFVMQTDYQAKNKSTSNRALTSHVLVYSLGWMEFGVIYTCITGNPLMLLFAPITFVCHWITDYITSRINTRLYKEGKIHEFFVSIGFDQWLHMVQLLGTYLLLV